MCYLKIFEDKFFKLIIILIVKNDFYEIDECWIGNMNIWKFLKNFFLRYGIFSIKWIECEGLLVLVIYGLCFRKEFSFCCFDYLKVNYIVVVFVGVGFVIKYWIEENNWMLDILFKVR